MKITVQSKSGTQVFDCCEQESILHAGLRQGLTLPYECATGTCGTCRARVMTGQTEVRWLEAPGGARLKREKGDVLMCQTRARSDCELVVPSQIMIANSIPPAPRNGVIRNIRRLTEDVTGFDIRLSTPMTFEAGQFAVIEAEGLPGGRAYSMVNFDTEVDTIALVLKRKPAGGFSEWLFGLKQPEPEVKVFGPLGRAVFRGDEGKNIVCIAGGSGIAGMMSILESASRKDYFREHKGAVFFGVRTALDAFYLESLSRHAAASHGNLEITVAFSHEAAASEAHAEFPDIKLASGMVHEVAGKAMEGRLEDTVVYVAGPPVMVDATIRTLIVSGVSSRDIRYDKFA